jgi:hypothetical protein
MMRPTDRALTRGSLDASDLGGLAEPAAGVNRAFVAAFACARRIRA